MLLTGLTAHSLIKYPKKQIHEDTCSIVIHSSNMWNSCIAYYKNPNMKLSNSITVSYNNSPVTDVGGPSRNFLPSVLNDTQLR